MSGIDSKYSIDRLPDMYRLALQSYLSRDGEETLRQAYELGRAAMLMRLGVLDIIEIHNQAVKTILEEYPADEMTRTMENSMVFLEESLAPYEITHRGYRDVVELARHIKKLK